MKRHMVFGALLLSVVLVGQGFGFELLDNLLGKSKCGCCEPACCEKAECCEPAACCEKACEPAACCEKECCEPACCDSCCKPKCDLFAGLKGLFKCKKSCGGCCEAACCEKACEPVGCCDDACCGETCCKPCCTPILDLLDDLCRLRIKVKVYKCCKPVNCCEPACCGESSCGDNGCGGGNVPAAAPAEKAAPMPAAPPAAAAKVLRTRSFYQVSRQVVRN